MLPATYGAGKEPPAVGLSNSYFPIHPDPRRSTRLGSAGITPTCNSPKRPFLDLKGTERGGGVQTGGEEEKPLWTLVHTRNSAKRQPRRSLVAPVEPQYC